jgi:hypothetical protein
MSKNGICPILTNGNNAVPCIQEKCAFWEEMYQKCGYICTGEKVADALERIMYTLNEMKNKM